jgi:transcriptional antiterminator NusG
MTSDHSTDNAAPAADQPSDDRPAEAAPPPQADAALPGDADGPAGPPPESAPEVAVSADEVAAADQSDAAGADEAPGAADDDSETGAGPAAGAEPVSEEPAAEGPKADDPKKWYIVKVQSGREESIKDAIERRVRIEGLEEYFGQIKIPVEKVTELRAGKRVVRSRKKFPGYLMANVEFNDRILYLFRETSGVGDFVGATVNRAPTPMPQHEVDRMLAEEAIQQGEKVPVHLQKIKLKFDKGDRVRVRDGTFQGMEGEVKDILEPKEAKDPVRVRVELTIFGRPVPVEVEAWQVDPV